MRTDNDALDVLLGFDDFRPDTLATSVKAATLASGSGVIALEGFRNSRAAAPTTTAFSEGWRMLAGFSSWPTPSPHCFRRHNEINKMTSSTTTSENPTTPAATPVIWQGHMANDLSNTYGATPGATLQISPEGIDITGRLGTFRIPREVVRKITRGPFYPWFFGGLRIHHTLAAAPMRLLFRPLQGSSTDIIARFRALNYPTS